MGKTRELIKFLCEQHLTLCVKIDRNALKMVLKSCIKMFAGLSRLNVMKVKTHFLPAHSSNINTQQCIIPNYVVIVAFVTVTVGAVWSQEITASTDCKDT